jgi:allantoinase
VAQARAAGEPVSAETCPHYLALDEDQLAQLGALAKCAPPLRARTQVEALWAAVLRGDLDCVASDHSPCPPADKHLDAGSIWAAWGGIAGVQTLLPVLLDEGVQRRGLPLPRLVRLASANPARRFGLYPRKGSLQPGADADFTIVDLERRWILHERDLLTRWPLSPFVGRRFRGRVEATIVRGTLVFADGRVQVEPGYGRLVRPQRGAPE